MSLTLALERSRSRQFGLLKQIRIFNAYCICRGIQPHFRWIPSELNSADEPSRIGTDEPSKLLTHLIPNGAQAKSPADAPGRGESKEVSARGKRAEARGSGGQIWPERQAADLEKGEPFRSHDDQGCAGCSQSFGDDLDSKGEREQEFQRDDFSFKQLRQQQRCRVSGKEEAKSAHSSKAQKKEICRPPHGRQGSKAVEFVGEAGNWKCRREDVPERAESLQGVCCSVGIGGEQSQQGRPVDDPIHEPMFLGWTPGLRWGSVSCQLDAPPPGVQQVWSEADPSCLEGLEGMEKALPWSVQSTIPTSDLVWHGLAHDGDGLPQDGGVPVDCPLDLHPALRAFEAQGVQPASAGAWSDELLEPPSESRRIGATFEDRRLRREPATRLSLCDLLGYSDPEGVEKSKQHQPSLGLQLRAIPECVQEVCQKDATATRALPHLPQRPVSGPQQAVPLPAGSAEERPMAEQQELCSLRESRSTSKELGTSERASENLLSSVRTGPRRHYVGPKGHSDFRPPRRSLKGQYVADLFSGNGGVALACRKLGFATAEWDIRHGHQCDLTCRKVLRKLRLDIKSGRVLAAMLAPPCNSFSVARDRMKVIRTRDFPWGLPAGELTVSELEKVKLGNACFKSCFSIIRLLDRYRIPWILENPATSKCWSLPFFQSISVQPHIHVVITDFCQYGTPWRKRTRFVCGNILLDDLHRVTHMCSHGKLCSATGKPHFQLTGKGPQGRNWTEIAQPYPTKLCEGLAYALTAPMHYNNIQY